MSEAGNELRMLLGELDRLPDLERDRPRPPATNSIEQHNSNNQQKKKKSHDRGLSENV